MLLSIARRCTTKLAGRYLIGDMKTVEDIRRENLGRLVEQSGGITALNTRLGRSARDSTFNQILNKSPNSRGGKPKSMGPRMARAVEDSLSLPSGWMDTQHDQEAVTQGFSLLDKQTGIVTIPRYDTGGSMGSGAVLRDQPGVIERLDVSQEWLEKNVRGYTSAKNLCVVTGFGDSMRPMYNPGDPLIVDSGVSAVEFDAVYFFRVGDEGFIKRLQRIPGKGLLAISENQAYRDWVIDQTMDMEVFGRVLKVWRSEDF